ncbi:MAG: cadmium-translocating P-type ATPase [Nitriliruptorales bacterium]|nr:cadmium-translocating P-type ATPase [Nitriliruptorales bacterium]
MADTCCARDHDQPAATEEEPSDRLRDVPEIRAAVLSGLLLAAGSVMSRLVDGPAGGLGYVPALLVGGRTFVPDAVRRLLRRQRPGVGSLMAAAAVGAVALGELGEAAALAFLFSISEGLEAYALARTRRGLRALLDLVPATVTARRDGREVAVHPDDLRVGDHMIVGPGERMATDGTVRSGRSLLDLSPITGESVPVETRPGDDAPAGAINGRGVLDVEVTAPASDSSLARIVHVVEQAQERKGASQRMTERLVRPLVPLVFGAAALLAVSGSLLGEPGVWVHRALVLLVAAAPCALAISVPVTVVAGIGAATRRGFLIKGGAALEALDRVRVVALDKTGTLTRNEPRVIEVVVADGVVVKDVLSVAAALERYSEHPLARAILEAAPDGIVARDVEAVPGHGLVGTVEGVTARLGRVGWVDAGCLGEQAARLADAGATVVAVARDGRTLGLIAVRDELRAEAVAVVAALRLQRMRTVMLTGDSARTARVLGQAAGVDDVRAELLPEDKADAVRRLQRELPVAMVGDGINDAPALAVADVGIAMGAMGADAAIETADVALMGDDLRLLATALEHAGRTATIMRQNLGFSAAILLTLVPLAALGAIGLAAAVAVHELAEVAVIANGVRAGRLRESSDGATGQPDAPGGTEHGHTRAGRRSGTLHPASSKVAIR